MLKVDKQYNAKVLRWIPSARVLDFLSQYLNTVLEGLHFELRAVKGLGEMAYTGEVGEDLLAALRCPACLAEHADDGTPNPGVLKLVDEQWLLCQDPYCGRKYPLVDDLPVMTEKRVSVGRRMLKKNYPNRQRNMPAFQPKPPLAGKWLIENRPPDWIGHLVNYSGSAVWL